jgi:hypothetical protein
VATIDKEIETRFLGHVDMLKIDTEGYDLHVLRGARSSLGNKVFHIVQIDYNSPWAYANSILHEAIELLTECGYQLLLLRSGSSGAIQPRDLWRILRLLKFRCSIATRTPAACGISAVMVPRLRVNGVFVS